MSKRHVLGGMILCLALFALVGTTVQADMSATAVFQPETLGIGKASGAGNASSDAAAGAHYRYQYLSGGATGSGWNTWNTNGDFARFYIQDSANNNVIPVFTYYNILQSTPATGNNEQQKITNNLANRNTMISYWNNMALFFEKAALFPDETIIFHVEPDMWGHMHLQSSNNNSANYSGTTVHVSSTGIPALSGIPNTPAGFAQAIFALRAAEGANHVLIAYHHSRWGVGTDYTYTNPSNSDLLALADEAAAFYNSLGQEFDLTFGEVRDRDAGFYQFVYGDNGAAWWDSTDYSNQAAYFARFKEQTGQNIMLWQVPYGNSTLNNTTGRYKDNAVETFLGENNYDTLKLYRDAGLIGILFGGGAPKTTTVDNDGGYFYSQLTRYNNNGALGTGEYTVTAVAAYSGSDGQNAQFSWTTNIESVDHYEVWSGTTADFSPGTNCGASSNCTLRGASTTYTAPTPALNEIVYYKVVAVHGDNRTESNVVIAYYLANHVRLPLVVRR